MRKHIGVILSVLILLTVVMAVVALRGYTQNKSASAENQEATPVQPGVMTEKQKKHSSLYKNSGVGKKLTEIARTDGSAKVIVELPMPVFYPDQPIPTSRQYLKELACKADAIVIGKVESKASQLTEEEDFVFTDYEMSVEEVIKNNPASPIGMNTNITITRPGGIVQVDGRIISSYLAAYKPFEIEKRYITFLSYVPTTNSYSALNSRGSFLLQNDRVTKLTDAKFAGAPENEDAQSLISELRGVVIVACDPADKGGKR